MAIKICVVNIQKEKGSQLFIAATEKALQKVRRPDTEITIKPLKRGADTHPQMTNYYGLFLTGVEIIERVLEAEKEGYDAVVVNGTLDRFLGIQQAKAIVNIPVISPIEATMLHACLLGRKFGMVALGAPYLKAFIESIIVEHSLQARAISNPMKFMEIKHKDLMSKVMEDPSLIIPPVVEAAKRCVEDGAEVIILIGTNLGVTCTLAGISSVDIDGLKVPLLNPLAIALKTAETMVDLEATLGLPPVSRIGLHRPVSRDDLKGLREQFGLETL